MRLHINKTEKGFELTKETVKLVLVDKTDPLVVYPKGKDYGILQGVETTSEIVGIFTTKQEAVIARDRKVSDELNN